MDEMNRINASGRSRIILGAVFILLVLGIALCLNALYDGTRQGIFLPVTLFVVGEFFLYVAFCLSRKSFLISLGFMFIFDGVLFSVISLGFTDYTISQLWPVIVINAGLSLVPADFFIHKRLRTIFLFPAILLLGMGILFLMFSCHVIQCSFMEFAVMAAPFFLILVGIVLIGIYIAQQLRKKDFPYMEDDSDITSGD